jgi:hypothetical protein
MPTEEDADVSSSSVSGQSKPIAACCHLQAYASTGGFALRLW